MNREDKVIDFYIQVADELCHGREWCVTGVDDPLRRFAALVAAAEREACAQICENDAAKFGVTDDVCAALIRARGQE